MARPGHKARSTFGLPLTPISVDCLERLSERFAALGRPMPKYRIAERAISLLYNEYCLTEPLHPASKSVLDLRYREFLTEGGKPARDAARQVEAHRGRKRIRQAADSSEVES